jgi:hypothetical protein
MFSHSIQIFLTFAACSAAALAASPAVGVALSKGELRIDSSQVRGNSTVFDGSVIRTGRGISEIRLRRGAQIRLGSESGGRVYSDRFVLDKGVGEIGGDTGSWMQALDLKVTPASREATARVRLSGAKRMEVAALGGAVRVTNPEGVLLASVRSGTAVELDTQDSGAAGPSKLAGRIENVNGRFLLTDEASGVTVELVGNDIERYVQKRVSVTGSLDPIAKPGAGASQVIHVITIQPSSPAAAHKGAGMSKAAKSLLAGVAVAGGATAATIALTGDEEVEDTISRGR